MKKSTADILLGLTGGIFALSSRSGGFNDAAFWSWFDNSKVVDSNDDPLVVYHGSQGRRVPDAFYLAVTRRAPGFFFTSSYENALEYCKTRSANEKRQELMRLRKSLVHIYHFKNLYLLKKSNGKTILLIGIVSLQIHIISRMKKVA